MTSRQANPSVLIVDDDRALVNSVHQSLARAGCQVRSATSGAEAERVLHDWCPDLILLDLTLPDRRGLDLLQQMQDLASHAEVVVLTEAQTLTTAVDAVGSGAFSFVEKPITLVSLVTLVNRVVEGPPRPGETDDQASEGQRQEGVSLRRLVDDSPSMQEVLEIVESVASSDASVLIYGESGTGKELIANAIHTSSHRAQRQFVKINCAAVPKDLIESELFGYTKGAFTGATQDRVGVFGQAEGGSLLLDEIGEMPPALQTKLLRVLQEREFRPLGATRPQKADFRLICTTNIDVQQALRTEQLREDLYFRINTISIRLPPLRDRPEDTLRLAEQFFDRYRRRHGRRVNRLGPRARDVMRRYPWPGNVRELEGAVEHAVLLAKGSEVTDDDLPEMVREPATSSSAVTVPPNITLAELEKQAILQTLERTGWNKQEAAHRLGLYRPTLYSKMRKHGILPQPEGRSTAPSDSVSADQHPQDSRQ